MLKDMIKNFNMSLLKLPTPLNISIFWNFGSLLGIFLAIQIITGFILSMNYCPNINMAFESIINIEQNISYGWLIRSIHMNSASFYFICMYIHIARGLFFHSFKNKMTWISGTLIFLMSMMTAFMGYVLPWAQMSYWAATVITNLMSTIPYIGTEIVYWIWGGYSINNLTLNRFYSLHFIMPFIILLMVLTHLISLHSTGSNNPLGLNSKLSMIPFHIYFSMKDIYKFMIMLFLMICISTIYPYMLSDPDNFIQANPLMTPTHIKPEWYFLFAYTILRSIPNKLGGVMALLSSILILLFPLIVKNSNLLANKFYPINQYFYWMLINSLIMLTWLGAKPIEYPFIFISQIYTGIYFSYFFIFNNLSLIWDKIIFNK